MTTITLKKVLTPAAHYYHTLRQRHFPTRLYGLHSSIPALNSGDDTPALSPKRALLSYITLPFKLSPNDSANVRFSNIGLARTLVQVLNDLGYVVDIVEYNDARFRPRHTYDLFLGHGGDNFEKIARALPRTTTKLYFSTGSYWRIWNELELARVDYLYQRRGFRIEPDRIIARSEEWANVNADGIIALGNSYVRQSYAGFPHVINVNNATYHDDRYDPESKDYARGRNGFLYFAGAGNLHKGLDLLLDAFSQLDEHLYVCQVLSPEFARLYQRELNSRPNIHNIGHISLRSQQFYQLVGKCNFVILPSCGEGQPGSVLDCMQYGLIPVVSKESNIDTADFGVTFEQCTVEEIAAVVQDLASRPLEWQRDKAACTREVTLTQYSRDTFYQNFRCSILQLLDERNTAA